MMAFMQAGGLGIWFVLIFGLLTGAASVGFVLHPDPRREALVQALSRAAVFSVLAAVSANLATVAWQVPQHAEWSKSPDMPLIVMTGIAESLTPAILGFSLLGIAWFITAFGVRRGGA